MYMKSLVSLAVLGAMSAVATAGDHVVFDKPNESYTVDGLSIFGATINASDITITNTAPASNGITAYGDFKLNAANDISIQGTQNGIFTPDDHANPSITIKTPKKLTITGPWAIHAEGEGTITIDAGDLVLRGSNGIAANSTGTVSIDAQTVDIASTNKYGVSSANTGGVTIKAEKSIYIKGGSANAVNGLQGAITLDSKGTTVVDGDILAEAATVSADFKGAGSSLTGAVTTGDTGKTTLGFSDGALWKAEGDSKVSYLTLKGGGVDLNNHDVTAVTLADNSAATIPNNAIETGNPEILSAAQIRGAHRPAPGRCRHLDQRTRCSIFTASIRTRMFLRWSGIDWLSTSRTKVSVLPLRVAAVR